MDNRTFSPVDPAAAPLDPDEVARLFGWIEIIQRAGGWGVVTFELKAGSLGQVSTTFTDKDGAALNRLQTNQ